MQRKQNHINLNLPRPCMRRDDVYSFDHESNELKLVNTHVGLKSLGKAFGKCNLLPIFWVFFELVFYFNFSERWQTIYSKR